MSQENEDQFRFEATYKKVKIKVFQVAKNYLEIFQQINPIFIYVVILLQFLQILSFSMSSILKSQKSIALNYVNIILSSLNLQWILSQYNNLLYLFVILTSTVTVLHIVTHVISFKTMNNKSYKKSKLIHFIHTFALIQLIMFNTIFTIPFFNVSFITLYCEPESPFHYTHNCYNSIYIVMCILSALNLLVLFTLNFLYWYIFYLRDPFLSNFYALPSNLNKLGKLLLKIAPPIYFVIDIHSNYQDVYIFMFLFLTVAYIAFFRILSIHNFSEKIFYLEFYLESVVTWFAINAVICFQFQSSDINFIQSIVCSLIFAYVVCTVESALTKHFIFANLGGTIKKQDRQKFIYFLINILFKNQKTYEITPIIYIKMLYSNFDITNPKIQNLLAKNQLKNQQMRQLSREIMLAILQIFFQDFSSPTLKIIQFSLLYDTGMKILAIHQAIELNGDKLSFYDEFMIFYFKTNHKIYETSTINDANDSVLKIETYLSYIEKMNQFESKVEICSINNERYWQQLCEDMPSINKVFNLAKKSLEYRKSIRQLYKNIEEIYQQNISCLLLYYHFLNDVCVHYKQCFKIKQKLEGKRKKQKLKENANFLSNLSIKYQPNQKMCVMHISTSSSSIGIIINCNSEVKKYLGYEKKQLINQKVTKIMPKIFSEIHDSFVMQYLKKADSIKLPTQKTVFALKKNSYVIETSLAVKVFLEPQNGYELVGFFKGKNETEMIPILLLNLKTFEIEGMNKAFIEMTGNRLKLKQIQKQPLKLSNVFPQLDSSYKFNEGQEINTLFRFSDCTDKLIQFEDTSIEGNTKYQKNVTIFVNSVHNYREKIDIAILTLKEREEIMSIKNIENHHKKNKMKVQKIKMKFSKNQSKQPTQIIVQEDIVIQQKIQDFLLKKSYKRQTLILKLTFLLCIFTFIISMLIINIDKEINTIDSGLQEQLSLAINVSIFEQRILIFNEQIIRSVNNATKWKYFQQNFLAQINNLQESALLLFSKAIQRLPANLVINQQVQYPFYSLTPDGKIIPSYQHYINGIIQITWASKNMFINTTINNFIQPVQQSVAIGRFFVSENMKQLLPYLAGQTIDAYQVLNNDSLSKIFINQLHFVLVKSALLILLYIAIFLIMRKIGQFSKSVVNIYQSIMKWDAHEIYRKCYKFRTEILQCQVNIEKQNQHNSNLLGVFPKSLLLMLTQGDKKGLSEKQQRPSVVDRVKKFIDEKNLKNSKKDDQQISQINKKDLIQLTIEDKFVKKFILILVFLLVICSVSVTLLLIQNSLKYQMLQHQNGFQNIGNFTKSFLATCYFAMKSIENQTSFHSLYIQSLNSFYENSKIISKFFIFQQDHIKQVYKLVEILNSIINGEVNSQINITKQQYISTIAINLIQNSYKILYFMEKWNGQSKVSIQNQIKIFTIIKTILQIFLTCIFCYVVLYFILTPFQKHITHSMNMVKMIPTWLVNKNSKIKQILKINNGIIVKQPPEIQKSNGKKNDNPQQTSENLLSKQSILE